MVNAVGPARNAWPVTLGPATVVGQHFLGLYTCRSNFASVKTGHPPSLARARQWPAWVISFGKSTISTSQSPLLLLLLAHAAQAVGHLPSEQYPGWKAALCSQLLRLAQRLSEASLSPFGGVRTRPRESLPLFINKEPPQVLAGPLLSSPAPCLPLAPLVRAPLPGCCASAGPERC